MNTKNPSGERSEIESQLPSGRSYFSMRKAILVEKTCINCGRPVAQSPNPNDIKWYHKHDGCVPCERTFAIPKSDDPQGGSIPHLDEIDVSNLADEAALAFIQKNEVRIETDSETFRALVRAFIAAYEAGKSSGYEQAREDAAKVADAFTLAAKPKLITLMAQHNTASTIAEAIRALQPEPEEQK